MLPLLLAEGAKVEALSEDDATEEAELTVTLTPESLELSPAETALDVDESDAAETPAVSAKARSSAARRKPTFMLED